MAKPDEDNESLIRCVSGDFDRTANFADVVNGLPTSGLKAKISGDAGASGSTPSGQCYSSSHVPRPDPPTNSFRTRFGISMTSLDRFDRSTFRQRP